MIEDKPIALITGLPGSGKTALIVKYIKEATDKGRPVFQQGIPELMLPHFPVPPLEEWIELRPDPDHPSMQLPYFRFPEGSLVVLSEAQRIYRIRASGSKIPDHVAAFETCRHTGVTFILDTQHPDFIDAHIRKLVGQHVHLLDHGVLGRRHYEWPYTGRPEDFKAAPIKKKYSLPKEIFSLYKSSSLHIKRKYTMPPAVVALAVLTVVIAILGFKSYKSIHDKMYPPSALPAVEGSAPSSSSAASTGGFSHPVTMESILADRQPRVLNFPESAPLYDELRKPKVMPVVVGCIKTPSRCSCVNQQGTDAGLDVQACVAWLDKPPFDPYRDVPNAQPGAGTPPTAADVRRDASPASTDDTTAAPSFRIS